MERVTGIGGVFFRAQDPKALQAWYVEHLGVPESDGYVIFPESRNTVWAPFPDGTDYWPGGRRGRVDVPVCAFAAPLAQLREAGVDVDEKVEVLEGIGRFGWAVDPEGNRFELWEPEAPEA
jgi:catechol 2,3-dioxygenase-like lactoylglutathione lyase family enzyme